MAIKAVLFDLDATLLPMNQDEFLGLYFKLLANRMARYGYDPKEVVDGIWKGSYAMIKNDGTELNEKVFWKAFAAVVGPRVLDDRFIFDEFYKNEFCQTKQICGYTPKAGEIVKRLKKAGIRVVLATNPLFPDVATINRMKWAGLEEEDFEFYTTYENVGYCKPNPKYYTYIANKLGLCPEECIMVGNDVSDDMSAAKTGMQVFLLTDCLINTKNEDLSQYPHGDFAALERFLFKD